MRLCLALACAVLLAGEAPEPEKSRARQLTEINAKIADLQRQIDYWQEKKRRLLDLPDVAAESKQAGGDKQVHTGPRNGRYHYSPSGRKVYERK